MTMHAIESECLTSIDHCLGFLHCDLNSLDATHPVVKDINDFDVLDIRDSIPDVTKMFYVVQEVFIMLLLDGFQGFNYGWMLVRTMKIFNEHDT
jgi:hypothetical protein